MTYEEKKESWPFSRIQHAFVRSAKYLFSAKLRLHFKSTCIVLHELL